MHDDGKNGDETAGDGVFTVELPVEIQTNRRLVRYRVMAVDEANRGAVFPPATASQPNLAYFVYDGIPAWSGAIEPKSKDAARRQAVQFSPEVMGSIQAYHLIAKLSDVENATWREQSRENEYKYTGTLVADGIVHDHVRFRARGGDWRYAMGKNMWKIDFNSGHLLQARNDYGQPYKTKWEELNLRACIQQGDYGQRGEQGMFEAVGFRLFNLAGVEAPHTHWIQLRIVTDAIETPSNQYKGDFWGLYLALENEDGRFLKEHNLPDGNFYKMKFGAHLSNQGANSVTNGSDVRQFMAGVQRGGQKDEWWRNNLDLPRYYGYRSILEAIHHYDLDAGKNYNFYFNAVSRKWIVIPWDIDLSWDNNMYGGGNEPFKRPVLSRPEFKLEYQNRLREIRDLLFNTDQTGQLIDECAAIISDPGGKPSMVDADRAKWDYHPIMISSYVVPEKAGQGLFYQASRSGDFKGMVQLMKNWVKRRSVWIDRTLLNDPGIPAKPTIQAEASGQIPINHLKFQCSDYSGPAPFAAMKWRVGEITPAASFTKPMKEPRRYEITPIWESVEIPQFQNSATVPPTALKAGRTYRARVRVKDNTGRWSSWSDPIEFVAAEGSVER
jgi:hypothetical protein